MTDCSYPGYYCDLDKNWTFCEGLYCTIHPKAFAKVDDYLYASHGTVNNNNYPFHCMNFFDSRKYTSTNVGPLSDIFVYILL